MRSKKMLTTCVFLIAILAVWPFYKYRKIERSFERLAEGQSREVVVRQMGKPWKDEKCGEYLGGSLPECVEEFVFANPFAPLVPEYWVLQFDSSRKLISHEHLQSP
jgi:hypothetical protein